MGAWLDTVFTPDFDLSTILVDSTNFLQYRVILQTEDPSITPVVKGVSFSCNTYLGINEPGSTEIVSWGFVPAANPSSGNCVIQVSLPHQATVDLLLYDVTGRVVARYSQELSGDTHPVVFNDIAQGVYFCTMHTGDFNATERIVVLK